MWKGNLPAAKNGIVVLGAPLGGEEFVQAKGTKRLEEERRLLDVLPRLPDLQCAWLLLYFSAVPRANHLLRTVPPCLLKKYTEAPDSAVWTTLLTLLNRKPSNDLRHQEETAQLPCRLGGCGLRCAARTAPAAYWAACADVLPTLRERFPEKAADLVAELEYECEDRECLREVLRGARLLKREGFQHPSWIAVAEGERPPQPDPKELDPGEWRHGWQYFASTAREEHHLKERVRPHSTQAEKTLLRSQAGRNCARALTAVPSDPALTLRPARFNAILCRRLRLPLLTLSSHCEGCGKRLDCFGDHLCACMRTGRVQARAKPVELAWARVFREAGKESGATVRWQHLLRNSTLPVDPNDNRRVDVLVEGLPLYNGRPLFCDATLRSPLKGDGTPHPRAAAKNGAVLRRALTDKATKYSDVEDSPLAELVVLACEVGGRWHHRTEELVRLLARNKVANVHPLLRRSVELAWIDRWWAMLGVAVQDALAASLLAPSSKQLVLDSGAAETPDLDALLDGQRWAFD